MAKSVHKIIARVGSGESAVTVHLKGRQAWCLRTLLDVGSRGFTTVERPAPRTADYVHKLRQKGVIVSIEMEDHTGFYSGQHARYRLGSEVEIIAEVRE